MNLNCYEFCASYNKAENNIAEEFYLPCMRASNRYDRISGYFGSTIYIIAWTALKEFIENGGKMRLICSPYISDSDEKALAEGYSARNDIILARAIGDEVSAMFESPYLSAPSKLLAYLVSEEIIDVKIAVPNGRETPVVKRMFHDKVGIFYDHENNVVGFRGSMNETFNGLSEDGNIESIDVFPNWLDNRDKERVEKATDFFDKLWGFEIPNVTVYSFPKAVKEILRNKSQGTKWEELLDQIKVIENASKKWKPSKNSKAKIPRPHQVDALEAWLKNGRRGIFEHATGSGKTFTAICAVNDALKRNEVVLILVPSRDLLKQWSKELKEILTDFEIYYMLCGGGNNEWRKSGVLKSWTSNSNNHRVIIATMDTASSDDFIQNVVQGKHIFVIADEFHRLGSPMHRKTLTLNTGARLGLSATPYRYGDPTRQPYLTISEDLYHHRLLWKMLLIMECLLDIFTILKELNYHIMNKSTGMKLQMKYVNIWAVLIEMIKLV